MSNEAKRHHITEFRAENVKKLRVVRLTPRAGGGLIEVSGANGSGKSSVLDAIAFALLGRGAVDPKPIRDGEETAVVTLTLGDVTVTRKFQANGGSTVVVESAEGARFPSPQKMLDELVGASVLSFDPLAFDRMKPADQLEEVRKVAPLAPEVDKWREEGRLAFAQRTDINRELKNLTAKMAGLESLPEPTSRASVTELLARLKEAHEENAACDDRSKRVELLNRDIETARIRAAQLRKEAEEAEATAKTVEEAIKSLPAIGLKVDTAAIESEIAEARKSEAHDAERDRRAKMAIEISALEEESTSLTATIEESADKVRRAVASAVMPVDGLTYGEDGLEFNGQPFVQASGAERLRVALGLAMAQRPGLRVVRIKDGSLLDEKSLAIVHDMAVREDFQVWIERVDTTGRVGIVLEDGEVVKVNGDAATVGDSENVGGIDG